VSVYIYTHIYTYTYLTMIIPWLARGFRILQLNNRYSKKKQHKYNCVESQLEVNFQSVCLKFNHKIFHVVHTSCNIISNS
jgi:hypothetical protein